MIDLHPGFADPVRDSQAVFRAVMDAMARPGRVHRVAGPVTPPTPLARATAAVLLTLVDGETPLWLDERAGAAWEWVRFHCGARASEAESAQFGVAMTDGEGGAFGGVDPRVKPGGDGGVETGGDGLLVALERFSAGSDEEPEESATVILQVLALGAGETLRLSGPGLAREEALVVAGLPDGFGAFWRANRRLFPRGIDVILCAGDEIAALPRTVEIS